MSEDKSAPVRQSQVSEQLGCIENIMGSLFDATDRIMDRLSDVLTNNTEVASPAKNVEPETLTPMATRLLSINHQMQTLLDKLVDIRTRTEL